MKLFNRLCLLALIGLLYSCSSNIMNDEDPTATLNAEEATTIPNYTEEFIASDHIVGYLDAKANVLYIMPEYQEITLQRLGANKTGDNTYKVETSNGHDLAETIAQYFSIVNVKERAMIYKLSTIRESETQTQGDGPVLDPVPIEEDYIIYNQAKCTLVWTNQVSPCTNIPTGSLMVARFAYKNCQVGEDICIETKKVVRRDFKWKVANCPGGATSWTDLEKFACN